jgi:hypothetical protein
MATSTNKPRDIKHLKARLGRTITPGAPGQAGASGATGDARPSQPGPPTTVGAGRTSQLGLPPTPPTPPAPPALAGRTSQLGLPAQPSGFPSAGRSSRVSLPPPPIARAEPLDPQQTTALRLDPFGTTATPLSVAKHVARVIDDDAPIQPGELGRKSNAWLATIASLVALLGLGVGYSVGSTRAERNQYKLAVHDGKDIYAKVQEASKTVVTARELLKQALDASSAGPGKKAAVDFDAVEQLVALKRPFSAQAFHRRLYRAFGDNTVDELFDYYNGINTLWDGFGALSAKTSGASRRDALLKSAAASDGTLNTDYGLVLSKSGDSYSGGLVFLTIPQHGADSAPRRGIKAKVSASLGGQDMERTLYTGQADAGEAIDKYVFMVDKLRSRTILGEAANLFVKFRADLLELNGRMQNTADVQERLLKGLAAISAMPD